MSKNYACSCDEYEDEHNNHSTAMLETVVVKADTIGTGGLLPGVSVSHGRITVGSPPPLQNPQEISAWGLLTHFWNGNGKPLTLKEIGLFDTVRKLVNTPNKLGKKNGHSLQGDFIEQILQGKTHFKNAYPMGNYWIIDGLWAIGGATIEGTFEGGVKWRGGFKKRYELRGVIHYKFHDKFTDPYDIFNWFKKDWNPNGTPFDITEEWSEPINMKLSREQAEKLKRK